MTGHFVTTTPQCRPCPRCHRLQLVGIDEGLPYRVEPAPLTAKAELSALLAGRRSYAVIAGRLAHRDATRITGDRRGRPPVFADHTCTRPAIETDIDTAHLATVTRILETGKQEEKKNPRAEKEINALFLLSDTLGARVIATAENPPF